MHWSSVLEPAKLLMRFPGPKLKTFLQECTAGPLPIVYSHCWDSGVYEVCCLLNGKLDFWWSL